MGNCTECGNQLSDGDRYCTKCGAPVGNSEPNSKNWSSKHDPQVVTKTEKFTVRQRLRHFFIGYGRAAITKQDGDREPNNQWVVTWSEEKANRERRERLEQAEAKRIEGEQDKAKRIESRRLKAIRVKAKEAEANRKIAERAKAKRIVTDQADRIRKLRTPFDEAIERSPIDSAVYVRLARFLIREAGFEQDLENIERRDPVELGGLVHSHFSVVESWTSNLKDLIGDRNNQSEFLLTEAKESLLKAMALAKAPSPLASANWKLTYVMLSSLLLHEDFGPKTPTATEKRRAKLKDLKTETNHYAREAEKDVRAHLKKHQIDDVRPLRMLALSIALYQKRNQTRDQRLGSIKARLNEIEIRQSLGVGPPSGLRVPGAPESPYPDNWDEIRSAVKDRDGHQCTYCDAEDVELHVHHMVLLSHGGGNDLGNLVTLCDICHSEQHSN